MPPFDLTKYRLRRATVGDAAGIAAAHCASIHGIGPKFYPKDVVDVWGEPRDPLKYIEKMGEGEIYFIVEPVHKRVIDTPDYGAVPYILGIGSYAMQGDEHHLQMLYIRPEAQGQGITRPLYNAVEEYAREQGAKIFHINGSFAGKAFYEAMGHRALCEYDHEFKRHPGKTMRAIKMMKDLTSP
jgi:GNAT superfamily N-acetyltransferase